MSLATRVFAASAASALLATAASAQYSTDFEAVVASPAGTVLTGQDGYYIPAGTVSVDFLAYTYAGNTLGVSANPTGGDQFVSVTGPGAGTFGRAQRDFAYSAGKSTVAFDIHASYIGVLPASQNLGSVSMQPFPGGQSFIALATWTDINTAATWNANYIYFDAAGTQIQEVVPLPEFQNLPVGNWYRWETDIDLATNAVLCSRLTDLSTGLTATYPISGRYMFGGAAGSAAPTGYRLFSGGGLTGNTLAYDNVAIGPRYPAPEIIHYTFDNGDAANTATEGLPAGTPGASTSFIPAGGQSAGSAAPAVTTTAATSATSRIDTGWTTDLGMSSWTVGMFSDRRGLTTTTIQYAFGNSTAGSFRAFVGGVAGATGFLLRGTGIPDTNIPNGGSITENVHVVWCYDAAALELRGYLNGVLAVTTVPTAPLNINGTGNFSVLGYGSSGSYAPGSVIDDFRFYRRCISEAEIQHWYAHGDRTIGTSYCDPAVANSTGNPAVLTASGSTIVELNGFSLHASGLPLNSFGYYLTSLTPDNVPMAGGGTGTLCLGGSLGRGVGGMVVNSGATGTTSVVGDLTMQPQPLGNVAVAPCETWYYQYWYRDIGTSNLTNAVSVMFQ